MKTKHLKPNYELKSVVSCSEHQSYELINQSQLIIDGSKYQQQPAVHTEELVWGGSVALAVGVSDMQHVTGDTQHVTSDS